jgi:hypothetical protein
MVCHIFDIKGINCEIEDHLKIFEDNSETWRHCGFGLDHCAPIFIGQKQTSKLKIEFQTTDLRIENSTTGFGFICQVNSIYQKTTIKVH